MFNAILSLRWYRHHSFDQFSISGRVNSTDLDKAHGLLYAALHHNSKTRPLSLILIDYYLVLPWIKPRRSWAEMEVLCSFPVSFRLFALLDEKSLVQRALTVIAIIVYVAMSSSSKNIVIKFIPL